jgi:dipeptidyl aminopeptidase/acylaminoacyl peptidase
MKHSTQKETFVIERNNHLPIVGDVTYTPSENPLPVVVFCHGYKGFKDWGAWNLIAEAFANAGFFFLKFNFSHNGGTVEQPIDFPDLEAFSKDNFSQQLTDVDDVLNYTLEHPSWKNKINASSVSLIGHSRGGAIVLIKAQEDTRVSKVITWAGISDIGYRFPKGEKLEAWKNEGVYYVENKRTLQQMPHLYQFYEDFVAHQERFHLKSVLKKLEKPYLIIHGTSDDTVSNYEAETLFNHANQPKMKWIANANHVFGASHPWSENTLPEASSKLISESVAFLKNA